LNKFFWVWWFVLTEEDKLFKSPEEKKREEKLVVEKTEKAVEKAGAEPETKGAVDDKAKKAVDTLAKKEAVAAKEEAEKKKKDKDEKKEKKREIVLQRVFVIPLDEAYFKPRSARARVATKLLQSFIAKHMKTPLANVRIAPALNSLLRVKGDRKPPKKVRVAASKDKEGIALAEIAK
jgi:ribosomal protein L31E